MKADPGAKVLVFDSALPEFFMPDPERKPPVSPAENKATVIAFYQQAFNDGQPEQAAAAHLGATYTQHNPQAPDGAEGFIGYVRLMRGRFPELHVDVKRAIAEDDLVVTHSNMHLKPGDGGMAVVDIWRVADGRIVEHWDVMQQVPDTSANDNTMF